MAIILGSVNEMNLLMRSIKPEIFRLIIVQHNHREIINQIAEKIQQTYTDRPLSRIQLKNKTYRQLTNSIYEQRQGILIIEDFQNILDKPDVYVAFNQRRDKIAQYPLALICFVPTGNQVLQECMKKLPDFWSFRNLVVNLAWDRVAKYRTEESQQIPQFSTLGGKTIQEKERELNRLVSRVEELQNEPDSTALINTYYPQILKLLEDIGAYRRGLEYAKQWCEKK